MGPTWVLSAPDGPHVGPWTLLVQHLWSYIFTLLVSSKRATLWLQVTIWCIIKDRPLLTPVTHLHAEIRAVIKTAKAVLCEIHSAINLVMAKSHETSRTFNPHIVPSRQRKNLMRQQTRSSFSFMTSWRIFASLNIWASGQVMACRRFSTSTNILFVFASLLHQQEWHSL